MIEVESINIHFRNPDGDWVWSSDSDDGDSDDDDSNSAEPQNASAAPNAEPLKKIEEVISATFPIEFQWNSNGILDGNSKSGAV